MTRIFVTLLVIITLYSCKKEEEPIVSNDSDIDSIITDQYIPNIQRLRLSNSYDRTCGDQSFTLPQHYYATIEYRFSTDLKKNENYFYTVEKKFKSRLNPHGGGGPKLTSWDSVSLWQSDARYYRYSFQEKKCFLYHSISDANPLLVFDFNVKKGDLINLAAHINSFDFVVKVINVSTQIINDIELPVITCYREGYYDSYDKEFDISPVLINPFTFETNNLHSELDLFVNSNEPPCSSFSKKYNFEVSLSNKLSYWLNY